MKLPWLLLKMRGMYEPLRIGLCLHRFICRSGGCSIGDDMSDEEIQQSQQDFMRSVDGSFEVIEALISVFLAVCVIGIVLSVVGWLA